MGSAYQLSPDTLLISQGHRRHLWDSGISQIPRMYSAGRKDKVSVRCSQIKWELNGAQPSLSHLGNGVGTPSDGPPGDSAFCVLSLSAKIFILHPPCSDIHVIQ